MNYVKPADVVGNMVEAGATKAKLSVKQLLLRGVVSGALLGVATSLAVGASVQTGFPIVGALLFPVGFVMIVLLGMELVTGSFALLPVAAVSGRVTVGEMLRNWIWVFLGNLLGSLGYAVLLAIVLTNGGASEPNAIGQAIVKIADAKTLGYAAVGSAGILTVFVKAVLCNWMVCLGVVMAMVSTDVIGKIVGMWLPILIFFAQGFEHSVVNMFVIPAGMLMGAKATAIDWWVWNQIPVTLGNLVGGSVFTGLALYYSYRKSAPAAVAVEPHALAQSMPRMAEGMGLGTKAS